MGLFETGKIYIFSQPVSWRYGIKGLSIYAATRLNFDIKDGENWFIFISKNRHATLSKIARYFMRSALIQARSLRLLVPKAWLRSLENNFDCYFQVIVMGVKLSSWFCLLNKPWD